MKMSKILLTGIERFSVGFGFTTVSDWLLSCSVKQMVKQRIGDDLGDFLCPTS